MEYKRIVVQFGGETLSGPNQFGIDTNKSKELALKIKQAYDLGVQILIVMGAGNFWRGAKSEGMKRYIADEIGMLATIMNSLALKDALDKINIPTKIYSSVNMNPIVDLYDISKVINDLSQNNVVIVGGGTGHPYFTTDTAAALRVFRLYEKGIFFLNNIKGRTGHHRDERHAGSRMGVYLPHLHSSAVKAHIDQ